MKTDAPHCHYGGEELFCAYENSRFGFYTATTVLHRKGALFNFAYTLAPYQHDYFEYISQFALFPGARILAVKRNNSRKDC